MKTIVIFAIVAICGCASAAAPPTRAAREEPIVLRVSLDYDFTRDQQSAIREAAALLTSQSRGWLTVVVLGEFGADFHVPAGAWRILATPPESELVWKLDKKIGRAVLGWVNGLSLDLHLVPARFKTRSDFIHVTMHELLHAIGAIHSDDPASVMWPSVAKEAPINMTTSDEAEIYRVAAQRARTFWP